MPKHAFASLSAHVGKRAETACNRPARPVRAPIYGRSRQYKYVPSHETKLSNRTRRGRKHNDMHTAQTRHCRAWKTCAYERPPTLPLASWHNVLLCGAMCSSLKNGGEHRWWEQSQVSLQDVATTCNEECIAGHPYLAGNPPPTHIPAPGSRSESRCLQKLLKTKLPDMPTTRKHLRKTAR